MSRLQVVERQVKSVDTLLNMTNVFESIAAIKIAKVKNQVQLSTAFFFDLWSLYTQLRVDKQFRFGRSSSKQEVLNKELYIIITSEGSLSGDIDQKLVNFMLKDFDVKNNDIIVIGHHGAIQLAQKNVGIKRYFKLPGNEANINVAPIIDEVKNYKTATVYYQEYVSLMQQEVKKITLNNAVEEIGDQFNETRDTISERNYIFEPSTEELVGHLEQSMMKIALEQLILESKLAQYASRFKAMSISHQAAEKQLQVAKFKYNRTKRSIKDDRLKEMINGMRKAEALK